jgi:hypothetical protein
VGFEERMADSHGLWFGANGALETRAGSSIAIKGRQASAEAGWLTPFYFWSVWSVWFVWSVLSVSFVWSVWSVWLNETNQMIQINQINKTNQINQIDQMNQRDQRGRRAHQDARRPCPYEERLT